MPKVFEEFSDYLNELDSEHFLVLESQAETMGFIFDKYTEPVAYLKEDFNNDLLPLFDISSEAKFITDDEWQRGTFATSDEITLFCLTENDFSDNVKKYVFQKDNFLEVFDLSAIIGELGISQYKEIKMPVVAAINVSSILDLECRELVKGYINSCTGIMPFYNIDEIAESKGVEYFKGEIEFPLVFPCFFSGFKNRIHLDEIQVAGYAHFEEGNIKAVYNVETVLNKYLFTESEISDLEIAVPLKKYPTFLNTIPKNYQRHLELKGINDNQEVILKGPKTPKWFKYNNDVKRLKEADETEHIISVTDFVNMLIDGEKYEPEKIALRLKLDLKTFDELFKNSRKKRALTIASTGGYSVIIVNPIFKGMPSSRGYDIMFR